MSCFDESPMDIVIDREANRYFVDGAVYTAEPYKGPNACDECDAAEQCDSMPFCPIRRSKERLVRVDDTKWSAEAIKMLFTPTPPNIHFPIPRPERRVISPEELKAELAKAKKPVVPTNLTRKYTEE